MPVVIVITANNDGADRSYLHATDADSRLVLCFDTAVTRDHGDAFDISLRMFGHELQNQACNLVSLFVQREMSSVEQVDFRIRKIVPECFGACCDE